MLNDNFFDNSLFILIRCRVFISQIVEKYFEKMFYFPLFFKHGRKPFTKFHYFPCRSQPIEAEPLMSTYSDLYLTLSCPKFLPLLISLFIARRHWLLLQLVSLATLENATKFENLKKLVCWDLKLISRIGILLIHQFH